MGDRLTGEEAFWKQPDTSTQEKHRDPKPNDPAYILAIDLLGRLYLSCLHRKKPQYSYQPLAIPGYTAYIFDPTTKALKEPDATAVERWARPFVGILPSKNVSRLGGQPEEI